MMTTFKGMGIPLNLSSLQVHSKLVTVTEVDLVSILSLCSDQHHLHCGVHEDGGRNHNLEVSWHLWSFCV